MLIIDRTMEVLAELPQPAVFVAIRFPDPSFQYRIYEHIAKSGVSMFLYPVKTG